MPTKMHRDPHTPVEYCYSSVYLTIMLSFTKINNNTSMCIIITIIIPHIVILFSSFS